MQTPVCRSARRHVLFRRESCRRIPFFIVSLFSSTPALAAVETPDPTEAAPTSAAPTASQSPASEAPTPGTDHTAQHRALRTSGVTGRRHADGTNQRKSRTDDCRRRQRHERACARAQSPTSRRRSQQSRGQVLVHSGTTHPTRRHSGADLGRHSIRILVSTRAAGSSHPTARIRRTTGNRFVCPTLYHYTCFSNLRRKPQRRTAEAPPNTQPVEEDVFEGIATVDAPAREPTKRRMETK